MTPEEINKKLTENVKLYQAEYQRQKYEQNLEFREHKKKLARENYIKRRDEKRKELNEKGIEIILQKRGRKKVEKLPCPSCGKC